MKSNTTDCICAQDTDCRQSAGFYNISFMSYPGSNTLINDDLMYKIPGYVVGCSSFDSLLLSTLECFYSDSECFSIVLNYIETIYIWNVEDPQWFNVRPLIYNSNSSHFPPNTSISEIVRNVMIEQWNVSFSYEDFYKTCAPNSCTYNELVYSQSAIDIIVSLISMIGGLVVLLRLITPYIVKFGYRLISKENRRRQQQQQQSNYVRLKNMIRMLPKIIYRTILDLNIFQRRDFSSKIDQDTVKYLGRWTTRLYFILLFIGLITLTLYSLIQPAIVTKTFKEPSFDYYKEIVKKYENKLKCPCQTIASKHHRFIEIQSEFHEV